VPDDGDANVFEILASQLGQNLAGDLILPERLLVALQPQLSQLRQDIHGVPSKAIKSAALRLGARHARTCQWIG
jgi:hypothetical protein